MEIVPPEQLTQSEQIRLNMFDYFFDLGYDITKFVNYVITSYIPYLIDISINYLEIILDEVNLFIYQFDYIPSDTEIINMENN